MPKPPLQDLYRVEEHEGHLLRKGGISLRVGEVSKNVASKGLLTAAKEPLARSASSIMQGSRG
jgi:hypothetical protein